MGKGSFQVLYTFSEVGEIYGIDSSSLRKQMSCEKLVVEKFETLKFDDYKNKKAR